MVWSSKKNYFFSYTSIASNLKGSIKFWKKLSSHKKVQNQLDLSVTCENINHHSLSISEKTVSSLPLSSTSPLSYVEKRDCVPSMSLSEATIQDVAEYISKLDTKKAVGVYGIFTKFI